MRHLLLLLLLGCAAPQPAPEIVYENVVEIEYRADGSYVLTFENGRVIVIRDGKEMEAF